MRIEDFQYHLPAELIAQRPPPKREDARLLVLGKASGMLSDRHVPDLPDLLPEGALLVANDSRVVPARLYARRASGGLVEVLLVEQLATGRWHCLLRASKRPRVGEALTLCHQSGDGGVAGARHETGIARGSAPEAVSPGLHVVEHQGEGRFIVEFADPSDFRRFGHTPLPPYITRTADSADELRYQTVYAAVEGSVAAPTAGLHFSEALRERLHRRGVQMCMVTLHVGPGTFVPVRCNDPREHRMEAERYQVSEATACAIAAAKRDGRPVVAVGTTTVRTLESTGGLAGEGRTDLFILPGHRFRVVDGLLTNFHLPGSTLLMLVAALAGRPAVVAAYEHAVRAEYRFYSYGDAMLVA